MFLIILIFSYSFKIIKKINIVTIKQPLSPKYILDGFLLKKENIIKNIIQSKLVVLSNLYLMKNIQQKTINSIDAKFKSLPS